MSSIKASVFSTRTVALFIGNYLSERKMALKKEELLKVLIQAAILTATTTKLNELGAGSFSGNYSHAVATGLACVVSEVVVSMAIDLVRTGDLDFEIEIRDLKTGVFQGIMVWLNDSMMY